MYSKALLLSFFAREAALNFIGVTISLLNKISVKINNVFNQ